MAARQARLTAVVLSVAGLALAAASLRLGANPVAPIAAAHPIAGQTAAAPEEARRIVSLIPATTEMLFAMGAGPRVVGVGSFDNFPPEVDKVARVGGLINPDTERILTLSPDLVVVYATQTELIQRLERSGTPYFSYEHRALPDVMATIRALGRRVGRAEAAEEVAAGMERALDRVRASVAGRPRPLTLLVFSRDAGSLRGMFASGGYGFLADLLDIAGGANVFADVRRQSIQVGTEVLLARRPEAIVELVYGDRAPLTDPVRVVETWKTLPSLPAVRNGRLHVLTGDEFVVPGPRIVLAAERLASVLHPAR